MVSTAVTRQVITIGHGGSLSGLQVKPGKGLDLRQFGKAKIERVSEILWDEEAQKWYVQIIAGPLKGEVLTAPLWDEGVAKPTPSGSTVTRTDYRLDFDDYDFAVRAEIEVLDAFRLKGTY